MADFVLLLEFREEQLAVSINELITDLKKFCSKNELYALIDDPYEFTIVEDSEDSGTSGVILASYYYEDDMEPEESMSFIKEEQEENIDQILDYLGDKYPGVEFELDLVET